MNVKKSFFNFFQIICKRMLDIDEKRKIFADQVIRAGNIFSYRSNFCWIWEARNMGRYKVVAEMWSFVCLVLLCSQYLSSLKWSKYLLHSWSISISYRIDLHFLMLFFLEQIICILWAWKKQICKKNLRTLVNPPWSSKHCYNK